MTDPVMRPRRIVVAITGASGAPYAVRLLQALRVAGVEIHLTMSPSGAAVIAQELGLKLDLRHPDLDGLITCVPTWSTALPMEFDSPLGELGNEYFHYHQHDDFFTPIASGSFVTDAMVICPCSGSTLSGIARAAAANLIQRAAEVHLKEHRKLIVVPRETPLSVLQLENMQRLAAAGAVVLPAMPGWYHGVTRLEDLVDFVVARILDQIGVENKLISRWKDTSSEAIR
ncbi:UbiX family flavin prenyltransferase [Allorhodopirellula heiligendammensis]|uniref:Flavin prenyltransferase UbiX n=1 Tax=Allorhodopirellula heiligendammensis TaxID=2714739 RepID=A0A5C6BT33_9BACT|nr:flavin prenyltransferase UbiX [Allorhodopirellula heiligendammensis]TWU15380.1 putative aromatic acid decarboxylase [Allorhodopirellula heiligendammensis]